MLSLKTPLIAPAKRQAATTMVATARRAPAPPRAGVLDQFGSAFVRLFNPAVDDRETPFTAAPFSGRIDHRGRGRARPFADGFASGGKPAKREEEPAAAASLDETGAEPDYMSGAVRSVMGKHFAGKEDAARPTTGAQGWQGDLHGRKRDGFHVPKL